MDATKEHHLKTWPEFFQLMVEGKKSFELRKNDRDFRVGDTLVLEEYYPQTGVYTGRALTAMVGYILHGGKFGLPDDLCIMQLENIEHELPF